MSSIIEMSDEGALVGNGCGHADACRTPTADGTVVRAADAAHLLSTTTPQQEISKTPFGTTESLTRPAAMNGIHSVGAGPAITTKGWTLEGLLRQRNAHTSTCFKPITRISVLESPDIVASTVRDFESRNEPLIVEDCHRHEAWRSDMFSIDWLSEHADKKMSVRNCVSRQDREMYFQEFIDKSRSSSKYAITGETERLYGKDYPCPPEWRDWLMSSNVVPKVNLPGGPEDELELLKDSEAIETLMCYLGIGDTYTPAHKDLCASSGQNLMVHTEDGGSSFWFMTKGSSAPQASEMFQKIGHELDLETHIAQPQQLAVAPFPVYIAEQKLGDLVLVPKRSCHQVVNNGGLTVKMSWSRMTVDGLVTAFHHELPIYRRVCRPETYRIKLLIYRSLHRYVTMLSKEDVTRESTGQNKVILSGTASLLFQKVKTLLQLFEKVIKEEYAGASAKPRMLTTETALVPSSTDVIGNVFFGLTCDFCGADIFQSFLECEKCGDGDDSLCICPGCYVEGRTCICQDMELVQRCSSDLLIETQLEACRVLFPLTDARTWRPVKFGPRTVRTIQHPPLFEAACKLWTERRVQPPKDSSLRTCSPGKHESSLLKAFYCSGCHHSKCFVHSLKSGIHASNLLTEYYKDSDQAHWHQYHIKRFKERAALKQIAQKAEEDGVAVDMSVSMAFIASRYNKACRPWQPNKVSMGWYDDLMLFDLGDDALEWVEPPAPERTVVSQKPAGPKLSSSKKRSGGGQQKIASTSKGSVKAVRSTIESTHNVVNSSEGNRGLPTALTSTRGGLSAVTFEIALAPLPDSERAKYLWNNSPVSLFEDSLDDNTLDADGTPSELPSPTSETPVVLPTITTVLETPSRPVDEVPSSPPLPICSIDSVASPIAPILIPTTTTPDTPAIPSSSTSNSGNLSSPSRDQAPTSTDPKPTSSDRPPSAVVTPTPVVSPTARHQVDPPSPFLTRATVPRKRKEAVVHTPLTNVRPSITPTPRAPTQPAATSRTPAGPTHEANGCLEQDATPDRSSKRPRRGEGVKILQSRRTTRETVAERPKQTTDRPPQSYSPMIISRTPSPARPAHPMHGSTARPIGPQHSSNLPSSSSPIRDSGMRSRLNEQQRSANISASPTSTLIPDTQPLIPPFDPSQPQNLGGILDQQIPPHTDPFIREFEMLRKAMAETIEQNLNLKAEVLTVRADLAKMKGEHADLAHEVKSRPLHTAPAASIIVQTGSNGVTTNLNGGHSQPDNGRQPPYRECEDGYQGGPRQHTQGFWASHNAARMFSPRRRYDNDFSNVPCEPLAFKAQNRSPGKFWQQRSFGYPDSYGPAPRPNGVQRQHFEQAQSVATAALNSVIRGKQSHSYQAPQFTKPHNTHFYRSSASQSVSDLSRAPERTSLQRRIQRSRSPPATPRRGKSHRSSERDESVRSEGRSASPRRRREIRSDTEDSDNSSRRREKRRSEGHHRVHRSDKDRGRTRHRSRERSQRHRSRSVRSSERSERGRERRSKETGNDERRSITSGPEDRRSKRPEVYSDFDDYASDRQQDEPQDTSARLLAVHSVVERQTPRPQSPVGSLSRLVETHVRTLYSATQEVSRDQDLTGNPWEGTGK